MWQACNRIQKARFTFRHSRCSIWSSCSSLPSSVKTGVDGGKAGYQPPHVNNETWVHKFYEDTIGKLKHDKSCTLIDWAGLAQLLPGQPSIGHSSWTGYFFWFAMNLDTIVLLYWMTYHLSFWPTLAKSCDIQAFGLVWVAYFCVAVPIGWFLVWFNAAFWIWADSQLSVVGNRFASGHSFTWAEAAQRVRDQLYENALHRGAPEQASFGGALREGQGFALVGSTLHLGPA